MYPSVLNDYHQFRLLKASCNDTATIYLSELWKLVYRSDQETRYSKPMPWIGMYTALASLYCVFAMVADLFHGFRKKKHWFPCNYFGVNAASLTMIAIAIKLPMDLTNLMPGNVDQAAKLGSLAFMCSVMANLLPSLATMEIKELYTNMIALGVLVITLVVDVCIQINTGIFAYHAIDDTEFFKDFSNERSIPHPAYVAHQCHLATIYMGLLLMLLMIYVCSSLAILKSKQILESKYQAAHEMASKEQPIFLDFLSLKRHVRNYWIMAGTGSPQFMTACSVTTSASGVICSISMFLHIFTMHFHIKSTWDYESDYRWSMLVILIIQFIGVIAGTIAPISRYFAFKRFKMSSIWNHIKVFKVESYWTQKLSDWNQSSIPFPSCSRKCKIIIRKLKFLFLNTCIGFQTIVVVACKLMLVLSLFVPICVQFCIGCWKLWKANLSSITSVQDPEQVEKNKDSSWCVLQLQDDMDFAGRTLASISRSVNQLIRKAEEKQPKYLMELLAKSGGFKGVEEFDSHDVPPLLSEKYAHCWSLPLVTLTTIAISLPKIQKNIVDNLLSSVSEGLVYVTLVEESLNGNGDRVIIQKAAKTLWVEVELYHKWLGNKLRQPIPQVNTTRQILQWFRDISESNYMRGDNSEYMSISANSMYRITETILRSYHESIDVVSQEELFVKLESMISDILAACLTNLPQVIAMKCHTSAIEKREANVQAAAQLLGKTRQIITNLRDLVVPLILNPDELAFIEKWRAYSIDHFP